MKLLYFAWLRQKIGKAEEDIDLPAGVKTVSDLMDWLARRDPACAEVLNNREVIRVAVNQVHASPDQRLSAGDEVALFPPVTGG